jgi:nucleoside-triphosphatase THEP1
VQVAYHSPQELIAKFLESQAGAGSLYFVSGPSACGKTHWCLGLVESAKRQGLQPAGLVSPPVLIGGRKVGIDLLDVTSGLRQRLAKHRGSKTGGPITADWQFDVRVIAWGNDVLSKASGAPLLVIDEFGPLELEHGDGLTAGLRLVTTRDYQLACIVVRPALLSKAQALWPWGQVLEVQRKSAAEALE